MSGGSPDPREGGFVVRSRLVSLLEREKLVAKARVHLKKKLDAEFSVYWRKGRIELPESVTLPYTHTCTK